MEQPVYRLIMKYRYRCVCVLKTIVIFPYTIEGAWGGIPVSVQQVDGYVS